MPNPKEGEHPIDAEIEPDQIERGLARFDETLDNVEDHKRRLINATGWWVVRSVLVVGALVLFVLGRDFAAGICTALFAVTFLFR